ncbi:MAG: hypothetical protein JWM89_576 [Acidimicrobiales bacterium]|nr:hypothetical protein [Acidimicrobiales bacterium]
MALIKSFEHRSGSIGFQSEVECGYRWSQDEDHRILVLESYGSKQRENVGKPSQSLHIDRDAAVRLVAILKEAFPGL